MAADWVTEATFSFSKVKRGCLNETPPLVEAYTATINNFSLYANIVYIDFDTKTMSNNPKDF